jgi:tRNA U34 2-thiouridine synthase MnmA/TrmU
MINKKAKALVLLSGGLDSILAVKLLLEQNIEVTAINFRTNFCGPSQARPAAALLGVPLREVSIREDFLPILRKPKHGYGAGLNPCIDCHALMLKKAGQIMRAEGFDFLATGEVLGERPMSQHKTALDIVAKEADVVGYLLRPLSAKLLEPTIAEKEGLVDREKLWDISGRSRKIQMALAAQYNITDYPTPAGGCALTQKGFSDRLRELMKNKPGFNAHDIDLVRFGRHFWIDDEPLPFDELRVDLAQGILPKSSGAESKASVQIILGRNKEENEFLKSQTKKGEVFIIPINFSGPEALLRGQNISEENIERAKELIGEFASKKETLKKEDRAFDVIKGDL